LPVRTAGRGRGGLRYHGAGVFSIGWGQGTGCEWAI